jgi:hypothetical protein
MKKEDFKVSVAAWADDSIGALLHWSTKFSINAHLWGEGWKCFHG